MMTIVDWLFWLTGGLVWALVLASLAGALIGEVLARWREWRRT